MSNTETSNLTKKQLKIAAVLGVCAMTYNLNTVDTEEKFIAAHSDIKETVQYDLSNEKAKEIVAKKDIKLSTTQCKDLLKEKENKLTDKYKVNHCRSKLKMK